MNINVKQNLIIYLLIFQPEQQKSHTVAGSWHRVGGGGAAAR